MSRKPSFSTFSRHFASGLSAKKSAQKAGYKVTHSTNYLRLKARYHAEQAAITNPASPTQPQAIPGPVRRLPANLQAAFLALPAGQQASLLQPAYVFELQANLEWLVARKAEQAEQAKPAPPGYLKLADGRVIHAGDYRILEAECLKDAKKICAREGNPALLAGTDGYDQPSQEQIRAQAAELILERASDWALSPVAKNCQQSGIVHRHIEPGTPSQSFQKFNGQFSEAEGHTDRIPDSFQVITEGDDYDHIRESLEAALPSNREARRNAYLAEADRRERLAASNDTRDVIRLQIAAKTQVEQNAQATEPEAQPDPFEVIL